MGAVWFKSGRHCGGLTGELPVAVCLSFCGGIAQGVLSTCRRKDLNLILMDEFPPNRFKFYALQEFLAQVASCVQSLLVTCRLHDIDPYDYFVDVLQRVGQHPASLVINSATPVETAVRSQSPRSDLHDARARQSGQ